MCSASHRQRKPDHDGWSISSGHDDPDHDDYDDDDDVDDGCGCGVVVVVMMVVVVVVVMILMINLHSLLCHLWLLVFQCMHLFPVHQNPVNDQTGKTK